MAAPLTASPVCKVTVAVFSTSSLLLYSVVCSSTAVGHGFVLAVSRSGHDLCSICSAVWPSSLQLPVDDGAGFIIWYMWALSRLWSVRNRMTTGRGSESRHYVCVN